MGKNGKKKPVTPAVPAKPFGATWLPQPSVYSELYRLHAEQLAELHDEVLSHSKESQLAIKKQWEDVTAEADVDDDDARQYLDSLVDDAMGVEIRERWSALLHCVALYHCLEGELGSIFEWVFSGLTEPERTRQLRNVHKWGELGLMMQAHCNVDITVLADHTDVDTLRRVCNAVKHTGGDVNVELAAVTGAVVGAPIDVSKLDLGRFRKSAEHFLKDFVDQANRALEARLGSPK